MFIDPEKCNVSAKQEQLQYLFFSAKNLHGGGGGGGTHRGG